MFPQDVVVHPYRGMRAVSNGPRFAKSVNRDAFRGFGSLAEAEIGTFVSRIDRSTNG